MIEGTRNSVLSGNDVRISNAPVRVGASVASTSAKAVLGETSHASGKANVREVRDASGNIVEIHVQCNCGATTVLSCHYS